MPLSPAAAAKKVGVSRALVSRALKDGSLKGALKNNGHWSISEDDLDVWASTLTIRWHDEKPADGTSTETVHARIAELEGILKQLQNDRLQDREELGVAKGTIESMKSTLEDLKTDRDAWRRQAEKVSELSIKKEKGGLFSFFFRS